MRFYMRIKTVPILLLLVIFSISSYAQRNKDYDYEYERENVWGITKNTWSGLIGGFVYKNSKKIKSGVYRTLGGELVNVKHPNEVRYNSLITGNFFIWAKENYLYAIRGQYGREMILFKKAPQQGIQINGQLAVGPTIGLETPYYIQVATGNLGQAKVPYESGKYSFEQIMGTGNLFQGLFESKIVFGANFKGSLSFEFGAFKSNVTGLELGFLVDAYVREVEMVPAAKNYSIYPTAFLTFFYGSRR